MSDFIPIIYFFIFMMQWNLCVYCNSTADLSVTLHPSESGVIFTGVVITNTVNTVNTDTLPVSSAQFDALLTNSAIDSVKSQSSSEISLSMKSQYNSDISQLTVSNSIINLPSSSAAVVGDSISAKQSTSLIVENVIVPTKTLVSENLTEKSKLISELSPFITKSENALSISPVTTNSEVINSVMATKMDESSSQAKTTSQNYVSDILSTIIVKSQIDVSRLTTISHSSVGVDIIPSSTSSSVVMATIGQTSALNTVNVVHPSSTLEITDSVKTSNMVSSGAVENSQTMVTNAFVTHTASESSFLKTSDQNLMSSMISGEVIISKTVLSTQQEKNSLLKSTFEQGISTSEETVQVSNAVQSIMSSAGSSYFTGDIDKTSLVLSDSTQLSTVHIGDSFIPSIEPTMTHKVAETASSIDAFSSSTTVSAQMYATSSDMLPGNVSQVDSNTISSGNFTQNVLRSTGNSMELTKTVSTNILSLTLDSGMTPSKAVSSLTSPVLSDINTSSLSVDLSFSQDMASIGSSFMSTTPQLNISDFETRLLSVSSDFGTVTSKITNSFSSMPASTSHNLGQTILPTSFIITTPQMNVSAIETQTLYTTSLEISSNALVNQSSTPDIMTSFAITTPQFNVSVFDTQSLLSTRTDNSTQIFSMSQSSTPFIQPQSSLQTETNSSEFSLNFSSINLTSQLPVLTSSESKSMYDISPTSVLDISSVKLSSEILNSTVSAAQSITPDFSSLFISLNTTLSIISSFETQNLSDILLTPSVTFETISTNQSQFSSEVNLTLTSVIFESTVNISNTKIVASVVSIASTPDLNFSSFSIQETPMSIMNYSNSLEVSNLTSDLYMTSEILPIISSSEMLILTATTDLVISSLDFLNFSTTDIPTQSTLTFNLTTEPITTLYQQTPIMSGLFSNSMLTSDILPTLNVSMSDMKSELSTVFQNGNESVSGDISMVTFLPNVSLDSASLMSDFVSTAASTLPIIIQPTMTVNSTPDMSSATMETLFNMTVVTTPSIVIFSSEEMQPSFTETLNETINFRTSFMSSQVVSSASVETPLNMSLVMTPSTYFFKSSQGVSSVVMETSLNMTTVIMELTTSVSTSNVITTDVVDVINSTYLLIEPSSLLTSRLVDTKMESASTFSTIDLLKNASESITPSPSIEISSSSMDANLSQSVIKSELISSSSTIVVVPNNSSEATAAFSKIEPLTSDVSTNIVSTIISTTVGILTESPSTSQSMTLDLPTSTGVSFTSRILTSDLITSSIVEMSSSVSMITAVPTSIPTATSIPTTQPTTTTTPTTTPTTTTPTTTPKPTTPDVVSTYWVKTGILVPVTEDVTTMTFKVKMEQGLAEAFNLAFQTQEQAGRRRRKRYVKIGTAGINVTEITRTAGTTDVSVGYTVDKDGSRLSATEAVTAASSISDQMMAIKLGYEVSSKAETYVTTQSTTSDEPSSLWIVGAVVGPVVFVVIVIWIVVCIIYFKKNRAPNTKTLDSESDPPLLRMTSPAGEDGEEEGQQYDKVSEQEANGTSAYKVTSPKKQKYKVNQNEDIYSEVKKHKNEDIYSEVKKHKRPASSKSSDKTRSDGESLNVVSEDGDKTKRKKQKQKRSSQAVAGLEDPEEDAPKLIKTTHLQSYEPQIDEDLQESKNAERKKNKQRLREKRKKREKDQDTMKQYLSGQEEINTILGQPPDDIPDVFVHKPKRRKNSKSKEGVQNQGFVEDESLRVARKRMHRLLDDAFSLISPTGSTSGDEGNGKDIINRTKSGRDKSPLRKFTHRNSARRRRRQRNKVSPETGQTKEEDGFSSDNNSVFEFKGPAENKPGDGYSSENTSIFELKVEDLDTGKKHEPMHVQTKHHPLPEALQTWSPYRAADQVALISMPNSMQTSLGRDPHRKSPGKRPIANLTYNGPSLTTESPKPIILRTRELQKNGGPHEQRKSATLNDIGATNSSNLSGLKSSHIGKDRHEPQHSIEMKNLSSKSSHSKSHKPHSMTPKNSDETDIVSIGGEEFPEQTLQSIRDELRSIVNSSKSPSRTKSSLADIS